MSDEKETTPLTRDERLHLFWRAPEFEQARRFAGDPAEYHYDDITDKNLDEARVPKFKGEPMPLPVPERSGLDVLKSFIHTPCMSEVVEPLVEIDDRPEQEKTNYLQVVEDPKPVDALLSAHRQVYHNLKESQWCQAGDPFNYINECLQVAEIFDIYNSMTASEKVVRLPLPTTYQPGGESAAILALLIQIHLRGWKGEVFSELTTPPEGSITFNLKIGISVTSEGPMRPELWDGAVKGYKKIRDLPLNTVEEFERYWLLSDRYTTRMADIQLANELVGDLSEGLDYTSYNESTVRSMWRNNRLNAEVQWAKENDPAMYQRFLDLIGKDAPADDDYDTMLTARIAKINGWPAQYSTDPYELADLIIQEQLKILPVQLAVQGSRQQALNRYCDLKGELEKRLPSNATGTEQ